MHNFGYIQFVMPRIMKTEELYFNASSSNPEFRVKHTTIREIYKSFTLIDKSFYMNVRFPGRISSPIRLESSKFYTPSLLEGELRQLIRFYFN